MTSPIPNSSNYVFECFPGVPIFPVQKGGKKPLTKHGFKDASLEPTVLAQWKQSFPGANVAIPTGAISGLDVLDLDVKDGRDGIKTLAALEAIHGKLPNAPTVSTPSGGRHLYFQHREGMRCSANRLSGVDVRADGGYVVVPPSQVAGTNGYEWVDGVTPATLKAPPWPEWLVRAIEVGTVAEPQPTQTQTSSRVSTSRASTSRGSSTPYGKSALEGLFSELRAVPSGQRDDRRNRVAYRAGRLVASGHLTVDDAIDAILQACRENGLLEDLGEMEVRKRIAAGVHAGRAKGAVAPPPAGATNSANSANVPLGPWNAPTPLEAHGVPDFPVGALPGWFSSWVLGVAEATQTPLALPGCVGLGVIALAAARAGFFVQVRAGWAEPINVYTVVAMPPGSRKSPVFKMATKPLVAWEAEAKQTCAAEIARANAEHDVVAHQLEVAKKKAAKAASANAGTAMEEVKALALKLKEMRKLVVPQLFTGDVTSEELGTLLSLQGEVMGVFSAEGGQFETIAGRYSNGVPNLDIWLCGHAGDPVRVNRGSRPPVSLDDPAVTLVLTTQPEVLHSLDRKPGFKGRGLLARIAYTIPGNLMGLRKDAPAPLDPAVAAAYDTEIRRMLDIDPPFGPMLERGRRELRLDAGAQERVRALTRSIEPRMGPGGDLEYMADWLGKYVGLVVRLAGLLHVTEWVSNPHAIIPEATVARAEKLGEFYLAHAIAGFDLMGTDLVTAGARHVLAWLRRKKPDLVTARDIYEGVKGSSLLRTMKALSPALKLLVDTNWMRYAPAETRAGPGRMASTLYEIHPTVAFAEFAESPPTTADDVPATSNPDAVTTCPTCGAPASAAHKCPAATSGARGGGEASS